MKFGREISFLLSLIATGLILNLVSYDETKVALLRMDVPLRQDRPLIDEISSQCRILYSKADTRIENFFLERLSPNTTATGTESCQLNIVSDSSQRFYLRTYWNFRLQVRAEQSPFQVERSFFIEFPKPLAFLPIAGFLLALIFEVSFWGLGWTLASYLFLLGGGNFIQMTNLSWRSTWLAITTEPTFPGLALILLWLAIYRNHRVSRTPFQEATTAWETFLSRAINTTFGLWNPSAYTALGRAFFPARGALARLLPFFDAQLLIVCLSLYLLSVDIKNVKDILEKSLFLPRYFSFAVILFLGLAYSATRSRKPIVTWQMPHFWRAFVLVILVELLALRLHWLKDQPTSLRLGIALVISELAWPVGIRPLASLRSYFPWLGILLLTAFLSTAGHESGAKDLLMVLLEPRMHPSVIVLFTFLAGLGLGFLTGNFSAAFFALFMTMARQQEEPLLRAALLDGILAGNLLSPFSLYNLLPMAQFGLDLRELITMRFKQLFYPTLIGATIYAVSAINSVAILQPVSFIFLCLLIITFQLRKSSWHLSGFSSKA